MLEQIKDRRSFYCIDLHTRRVQMIYFSRILHFGNSYGIKMINKSIKLETKTVRLSPLAPQGPPAGAVLVCSHPHGQAEVQSLEQDTLCSQQGRSCLAREAGRHSRHGLLQAWLVGILKTRSWFFTDEHSQGVCFRCPCQTVLLRLWRRTEPE